MFILRNKSNNIGTAKVGGEWVSVPPHSQVACEREPKCLTVNLVSIPVKSVKKNSIPVVPVSKTKNPLDSKLGDK